MLPANSLRRILQKFLWRSHQLFYSKLFQGLLWKFFRGISRPSWRFLWKNLQRLLKKTSRRCHRILVEVNPKIHLENVIKITTKLSPRTPSEIPPKIPPKNSSGIPWKSTNPMITAKIVTKIPSQIAPEIYFVDTFRNSSKGSCTFFQWFYYGTRRKFLQWLLQKLPLRNPPGNIFVNYSKHSSWIFSKKSSVDSSTSSAEEFFKNSSEFCQELLRIFH